MIMMNEITVNNIKINNLEPTKKNFINKNKKFSAKGYFKDIKVKVYEVFDQNQGDLRAFISSHESLSSYFPKLIAHDNKYIVEEWIEGKTLKKINAKNLENIPQSDQIKKIIENMWSIKYDKIVFDYIDYIHRRVNKENNFDLSSIPNKINHNDLSLDNILMTSDGLKIIDNEFLGCNSGWILNVKNSFLKENFEYQNFVSEDILNKLWDVRKEWSKLIKKDQFNIKTRLYKIFKNYF
jgi:serine/threonine protein kinase